MLTEKICACRFAAALLYMEAATAAERLEKLNLSGDNDE
jgi:hypothetical protein